MSPRIRIADGLLTQSAERLITTASAIIKGLTGNPSFPSPPVDLKTVQAAVDDRTSEGAHCHKLWEIFSSCFLSPLDENEEMVARGSWLYGTVQLGIVIRRRQVWYGSGDYEDPPEISDDRNADMYVVAYEAAGSAGQYADGGQFLSLTEAKHAAENICGATVIWE
jgi:hypothetical protein